MFWWILLLVAIATFLAIMLAKNSKSKNDGDHDHDDDEEREHSRNRQRKRERDRVREKEEDEDLEEERGKKKPKPAEDDLEEDFEEERLPGSLTDEQWAAVNKAKAHLEKLKASYNKDTARSFVASVIENAPGVNHTYTPEENEARIENILKMMEAAHYGKIDGLERYIHQFMTHYGDPSTIDEDLEQFPFYGPMVEEMIEEACAKEEYYRIHLKDRAEETLRWLKGGLYDHNPETKERIAEVEEILERAEQFFLDSQRGSFGLSYMGESLESFKAYVDSQLQRVNEIEQEIIQSLPGHHFPILRSQFAEADLYQRKVKASYNKDTARDFIASLIEENPSINDEYTEEEKNERLDTITEVMELAHNSILKMMGMVEGNASKFMGNIENVKKFPLYDQMVEENIEEACKEYDNFKVNILDRANRMIASLPKNDPRIQQIQEILDRAKEVLANTVENIIVSKIPSEAMSNVMHTVMYGGNIIERLDEIERTITASPEKEEEKPKELDEKTKEAIRKTEAHIHRVEQSYDAQKARSIVVNKMDKMPSLNIAGYPKEDREELNDILSSMMSANWEKTYPQKKGELEALLEGLRKGENQGKVATIDGELSKYLTYDQQIDREEEFITKVSEKYSYYRFFIKDKGNEVISKLPKNDPRIAEVQAILRGVADNVKKTDMSLDDFLIDAEVQLQKLEAMEKALLTKKEVKPAAVKNKLEVYQRELQSGTNREGKTVDELIAQKLLSMEKEGIIKFGKQNDKDKFLVLDTMKKMWAKLSTNASDKTNELIRMTDMVKSGREVIDQMPDLDIDKWVNSEGFRVIVIQTLLKFNEYYQQTSELLKIINDPENYVMPELKGKIVDNLKTILGAVSDDSIQYEEFTEQLNGFVKAAKQQILIEKRKVIASNQGRLEEGKKEEEEKGMVVYSSASKK